MREPTIKIVDIASHRNGSGGTGFHIVLFKYKTENNKKELFMATVFPEDKHVAVICLDRLPNIKFGIDENSWEGYYFESALRKSIEKYENDSDLELL